MRKILILLCALAVFGLTLAAPDAEAQGYNIRRDSSVMKVAQYANNALTNKLTFMYDADGNEDDVNIVQTAGNSPALKIQIGYGLIVTNKDAAREKATAPLTIWCDNDGNGTGDDANAFEADCQAADQTAGDNPSATISNEGGTGVITITIGSSLQSFVVVGVRVDASALAVKDTITASITSTTDATTVPLGGADTTGGVSGIVGEVAAGLNVTAAKAASLSCSSTNQPTITLAEGFAGAWGPTNLRLDDDGPNAATDNETASIKIVLDNLPDDAKVEWPGTVDSMINLGTEAAPNMQLNGTLKMDTAESSSNGKVVVYDYTMVASYDAPSGVTDDTGTTDVDESVTDTPFTDKQNPGRSFAITPDKTTFKGDASVDVSAMLYPSARRGTDGEKLDLGTMLSFEAELQAPEKGNGEDWLVISECVTYLLYPFITCGAVPGWSTGISVSNTTADANVFGAFDGTSEQDGGVVLYGFPKDRMLSEVEGEDEVATVEAVVDTISDDLKAGETMTFDCGNTMMAGMEGYAIIRAGFQHARGMAFVMGNFPDGAGVDVSHGYMAEVINDPGSRSDALE